MEESRETVSAGVKLTPEEISPGMRDTIEYHPDGEAANEIAHIVTKVLGWQNLRDRYGIAHRVLTWLDTNRPDGLKGGHR